MLFWIALAVLLVAVAVGLTYDIVHGRRLYRQMKATGGRFSSEVEHVQRVSEEIQVHLQRAEESAARLQESGQRLQASTATLQAQATAYHDARAEIRRTLWFVPGL